jgi:hypothetical protein
MVAAPFADFTWRPAPAESDSDDDAGGGQLAAVIPFGVFDADAEASRW